MKINLFIPLLFGLLYFFSSCSENDGKWDDNIKLSIKEARLNATTDSLEITTEGEGWWISDVSLNNDHLDIESVNTNSNNFEITSADFKIIRKSSTILKIKMNDNLTGNERLLRIGLQAGNYFDGIKITQDN